MEIKKIVLIGAGNESGRHSISLGSSFNNHTVSKIARFNHGSEMSNQYRIYTVDDKLLGEVVSNEVIIYYGD